MPILSREFLRQSIRFAYLSQRPGFLSEKVRQCWYEKQLRISRKAQQSRSWGRKFTIPYQNFHIDCGLSGQETCLLEQMQYDGSHSIVRRFMDTYSIMDRFWISVRIEKTTCCNSNSKQLVSRIQAQMGKLLNSSILYLHSLNSSSFMSSSELDHLCDCRIKVCDTIHILDHLFIRPILTKVIIRSPSCC